MTNANDSTTGAPQVFNKPAADGVLPTLAQKPSHTNSAVQQTTGPKTQKHGQNIPPTVGSLPRFPPSTMGPVSTQSAHMVMPVAPHAATALQNVPLHYSQFDPIELAGEQQLMYQNFLAMPAAGIQAPPAPGFPVYPGHPALYPAGYYPVVSYNPGQPLLPGYDAHAFASVAYPTAASVAQQLDAAIARNHALLQESYATAKADFDNITLQVNELDHYLAIRRERLDQPTRLSFAAHRIQMVEQRAAAKAGMDRLQSHMDNHQSLTSPIVTHHRHADLSSKSQVNRPRAVPAKSLNVQAASWVPPTVGNGDVGLKPHAEATKEEYRVSCRQVWQIRHLPIPVKKLQSNGPQKWRRRPASNQRLTTSGPW